MKIFITCISLFTTILFAQSASAELTKLTDNVYSYVGVKDASPSQSLGVIGNKELTDISVQVRSKMERVLAAL